MKKVRIVVVGGGWGGCAAALGASKAGADVTLLERTDMLLGTGLVGGIYRNNGRYTAAEEMIAMGGGTAFSFRAPFAFHLKDSRSSLPCWISNAYRVRVPCSGRYRTSSRWREEIR